MSTHSTATSLGGGPSASGEVFAEWNYNMLGGEVSGMGAGEANEPSSSYQYQQAYPDKRPRPEYEQEVDMAPLNTYLP